VLRPTPPTVSNPDRCGWEDCAGCAAVAAFEAKRQAGELGPAPVLPSPWWQSAQAAASYARAVNLPPCQHPNDLPAWPAVPALRLRASA
jgi:hypothetical protein